MKQHTEFVNIGDTDQNADWIKTPKNRRSERRIHEQIQREREKEQQEQEPTE